MSYNYQNQRQNYNANRTNQGIPETRQQFNQPQAQPQGQPNQMNREGFNDPFFSFGNQGFNMDIREDFDDPFSNMGAGNHIRAFGFPDIASIERQMFGHIQDQMNSMQQLSDGIEQNMNNMNNMNNNQQQLTTGAPGQGQRGLFISMQGGHGPGTMISKTYCSKIDYSSGQPKEESYQSQAIKQIGEGGHSISEQQEAYKNSMTGIQKAAHQRLLDEKGTKLIKQRNINTGEQSEHNILKGLQENEVDGFNKQYNDYREKVHFQDNYKYLNSLNPGKMVKQLGQGKGQGNGQQSNFLLGDGSNQNSYQPGNQFNNTNQPSNQYYNNRPQNRNQGQNNAYNPYPNNQNNPYPNNQNNYRRGF